MKVLILGAGAIGSFIGAKLSSVSDVVLFSRNRAHIQKIQKEGLIIEELTGEKKRFHLKSIFDLKDLEHLPDLIIVLVKSYDTEEAVSSVLSIKKENTLFLTLQNGIGNVEKIAKFIDSNMILAGTTAMGSALIEPGYIKHGGSGPTYFGKITGPPDELTKEIASMFNKAGLETYVVEDPNLYIWKKLIINTGINAITAIAQIKNGWIYKNRYAKEIAQKAVEEAVSVANKMGIEFKEDMVETMLNVAKATSENISSMYQDILKGKRTEIDAINGAIVRFAKDLGVHTPINQTLTNLVKIIEEKVVGK